MKCFMTNQDCIHEKAIQKYYMQFSLNRSPNRVLKFFVVSPFGYPFNDLYNEVILRLKNKDSKQLSNWEIVRADRAVQLGFIMCQKICKEIRTSDYVIVDLSEANANVYYELGLAFGYGRRIILLLGDKNLENNLPSGWKQFISHNRLNVVTYDDFLSLSENSHYGFDKLKRLILESGYNSSKLVKDLLDPKSYIGKEADNDLDPNKENKKILFCIGTPFSDHKLLLKSAESVANRKNWEIVPYDINLGLDIESFIEKLKKCKVCLIDVTHYSEHVNPNTYWILGLSHALGRDTIPITNQSKSGDYIPFDVRGLYQIYYKELGNFRDSLHNILDMINEEFDKEVQEYPQKYIWDRILNINSDVRVYTFGRGKFEDPQRDGGRTNVDTWDYQAVGLLAFFLAQNYKQATVEILPPEDKRIGTNQGEIELRKKSVLENLLPDKNYIIVGSPDVSDYAEILLASKYGIEPYKQLVCSESSCKGNNCKAKCIGRQGYVFYKRKYFSATAEENLPHPRSSSFCYRDANDDKAQQVLWYSKPYPIIENITYGVISIFYGGPNSQNISSTDKFLPKGSVIILSGYTGIATYGLASLLTGKLMMETIKLQKMLAKYPNEKAVQILVQVNYGKSETVIERDSRTFSSIEVIDVQVLSKIC